MPSFNNSTTPQDSIIMGQLQDELQKVQKALHNPDQGETMSHQDTSTSPQASAATPPPKPQKTVDPYIGGKVTIGGQDSATRAEVFMTEEERSQFVKNVLELQQQEIKAKTLDMECQTHEIKQEATRVKLERAVVLTQGAVFIATLVGIVAGGLAIRRGLRATAEVDSLSKANSQPQLK